MESLQLLGKLQVPVLQFLQCGGPWFQAHVPSTLTNFIQNFVSVLLAENIEEHGNRNDRIVTKEMHPDCWLW